jgi:hypothetical protein
MRNRTEQFVKTPRQTDKDVDRIVKEIFRKYGDLETFFADVQRSLSLERSHPATQSQPTRLKRD